jgi:hypothetical protein
MYPDSIFTDTVGQTGTVEWISSDVKFTQVVSVVKGTVIGSISADSTRGDDGSLILQKLVRSVSQTIPESPQHSTPLWVRGFILGSLSVILWALAVIIVSALFGQQTTGIVAFSLFLLLLGAWLFILALWPRIVVRRAWRQGDHDGTLRRALASRGITLP